MSDQNFFFWIAESVTDAAIVNPNRIKILSTNVACTFFINGNLPDTIGLRQLRNPTFWLLISLVVTFNKIPLFSKDLITFITSFISLLTSVSPEPLKFGNLFKFFLSIMLGHLCPTKSPISLLFKALGFLYFNYFSHIPFFFMVKIER